MSIPYMPLYVTDYEGDTTHLTIEEDGAYMRLLRLCWRTPGCSVPDDPVWIARKMRVDIETFERLISPLISEYFKSHKGRVFQKRQQEIFVDVNSTSKKRSNAGKRGGRPSKSLKTDDTGESPASAPESPDKAGTKQPEPEPIEEKDKGKPLSKKSKRGSRINPDWKPSAEDISFAKTKGLTPDDISLQAEQFLNHWLASPGVRGIKLDWPATWRNWIIRSKQFSNGNSNAKPKIDAEDIIGRVARTVENIENSWNDGGANGGHRQTQAGNF